MSYPDTRLFIDGQWQDAAEGKTLPVLNPATGQVIGQVAHASRADLDAALAKYNAQLPKLEEFILPAGNRAASQAHICRTVARRAERATVALGNEEALNDAPRQYLNRLSDLMFVLSRVLNRMDGGTDVYWQSERMKK